MSSQGAVLTGLLAGVVAAVATGLGLAASGSSAVRAGLVLALAAIASRVLLLVGLRRAARAADEEHPFGYGRERWVAAFVGGLLLFALAGAAGVDEGVRRLRDEGALERPGAALAALGVAALAELVALVVAVRASAPSRGSMTWSRFLRAARRPELPLGVAEAAAALVGLLLALVGVALADVTGDREWDALGAVALGLLLLGLAVVLVGQMRSLLVGESASAADVQAVRAALVGEGVRSVIHLRTQQLGPEELMVGAKIALTPGIPVEQVAAEIDAAELRVRTVVPAARVMYLEPDVPH